jgi:hypothetical protein
VRLPSLDLRGPSLPVGFAFMAECDVVRAMQTLSGDVSAATRRRRPVAIDGGAESHP